MQVVPNYNDFVSQQSHINQYRADLENWLNSFSPNEAEHLSVVFCTQELENSIKSIIQTDEPSHFDSRELMIKHSNIFDINFDLPFEENLNRLIFSFHSNGKVNLSIEAENFNDEDLNKLMKEIGIVFDEEEFNQFDSWPKGINCIKAVIDSFYKVPKFE